jgi:hypothetical protein
VSVFATERLPQPMAVSAAVSNDILSRTLVVRLPEKAGGYEKLLWREAFQAFKAAEENGWQGGTGPCGRLPWAVIGLLTLRLVIFKHSNSILSPARLFMRS